MHGYESVALTPSTEQVLAHKHPDEHQVAMTLDRVRRDRAAFSTCHRIITTTGEVRHVVVASDTLRDESGTVIGTHGFYVDVTPTHDSEQRQITQRVAEVSDRRAIIEQAKGMLAMVYGVDDETAFAVLRWRSQVTNSKLRALAEQLVADFRKVSGDALPPRSVYDGLVLSIHERLAPP